MKFRPLQDRVLIRRGESGANLSLAGIRLPNSTRRGFPPVCGPGQAARSAETRRMRPHRADGREYLCRAIFQYRTAGDGGSLTIAVV